jgi:hypothetical protein
MRCVELICISLFRYVQRIFLGDIFLYTESLIRYEGVSISFRTCRLERELQIVQLSVTKCSCMAILCVSPVSFAAITLCVASQRVFNVVVYFVIDSIRKLLDTPSYNLT